MPKYRILCPKSQRDELPDEVTIEEAFPAFVIASAPEEVIEELRKRYPVEELAPHDRPEAAADMPELAAAATRAPNRGPYTVVVRFRAPVRKSWLKKIEKAGCRVTAPLGNSAVVARCRNKAQLNKLQDLPDVESVDPHVPVIRLSPTFFDGGTAEASEQEIEIAAEKLARGETPSANPRVLAVPGTLVASFYSEEDCDKASRGLRRQRVDAITKTGPRTLLINVLPGTDPLSAVQAILARSGLRRLEQKTIPKNRNDVARLVVANRVVTPNPTGLGLTGEDESVAVADTGLDTGDAATVHLDFRNRVREIRSFPIAASLSPLVDNPGGDDGAADIYSGHGTHVSGSVLSDGAQSRALGLSPIQGIATQAELVFQAVEQTPQWNRQAVLQFLLQGRRPPHHGLFGIPDNLRDLFQAAFDHGARIHSNSWGGGDPGEYDQQCEELDRFVWDHKDFCILVAAGNDGTDVSPPGQGIDPGSVTSPGTAKNCLTVGASENRRNGQFSDTYGEWWPDDYPRAPFRSDPMVDSVEHVAAFSSRGPCTTGRRKPDLLAPGTFVLSTRSSQMPANNFAWGAFADAKTDYMYMGGTSMATPLVAGCTALVRQHLRKTVGIRNPSAALLKAALIHSAQYVPYRHAHPSSAPFNDNEQGWGHVDLGHVLNPQRSCKVLFVEGTRGLSTGQAREHKVKLTSSNVPLRATLVYTDFPGDQLVNNLNLVASDPSGAVFVGNDFEGTNRLDSVNNVEGIVVDAPKRGVWTVQVIGSEILEGTQHYALVVSGPGTTLS